MNRTPAIEREPRFNVVRLGATDVTRAAGVRPGDAARREELGRLARLFFPWFALLLITLCWDRAVYVHVTVADAARAAAMKESGWYIALRSLGTLYPWAGLAILFLLMDLGAPSNPARLRNPFRRAVFLMLSPVLAGGIAEILKPLVGRFKPEETDGWFQFAALSDRVSEWSDLGMASSHTAVAFGAAFALSYILPRGAPLFITGAVGCALTRLLAGGHFLSDVYVGIVISYLVVRALHALDLRNNSGAAISA